mmetsp:Transcript_4309/g.4071  ORF Transcript_4309/g.4071 Transcript_4309/m.4071 type:complete len:105 (+) Transcript_4309:857-1171(+)
MLKLAPLITEFVLILHQYPLLLQREIFVRKSEVHVNLGDFMMVLQVLCSHLHLFLHLVEVVLAIVSQVLIKLVLMNLGAIFLVFLQQFLHLPQLLVLLMIELFQ